MSLTIQLPADIELDLREKVTDLDHSAKEAMLVEFYRQQKLSRDQLARALGVGVIALDEVLKRHEAYYHMDVDDVFREARSFEQLKADADRR